MSQSTADPPLARIVRFSPRSSRLKFGASFVVLVIALVALWAQLANEQEQTRGMIPGLPGPITGIGVHRRGINVSLDQLDPATLDTTIRQIDSAGLWWLRQTFLWSQIEPEPGHLTWDKWDRIVTAVPSGRLIAVLGDSPDWAVRSGSQGAAHAPPADPATFARFAGALAARYRDRIDVYQIWDEPNLASGWGGQPVDATQYAALLSAASQAIHAANPHALVLTAGLAPTNESGPDNLNEVLYLRALYQAGAGKSFDAVAAKPYGFDAGPEDRRVDPVLLNFSRVILLREEMVRDGDASKALWGTQFGWNSLPAGWTGQPSLWGQTSPEQQARWTLAAFQRAEQEWPWMGALLLENYQPAAASDSARWGFAIVDRHGSPRPIYETLKDHRPDPALALPGWHSPQDPAARYQGGWRFSDLGADISQSGDRVKFSFLGTDLGLTVRQGNYRANFYVTVDSQPANALPADEQGAYLNLSAPDPEEPGLATVLVARDLAPGEHTAEFVAERGWGQWALAGFSVGSFPNAAGFRLGLAATGLIALLALAGCFVYGGRAGTSSAGRALVRRINSLGGKARWSLAALASATFWLSSWLTWGGLAGALLQRLGDSSFVLGTATVAAVFVYSPLVALNLVSLIVMALLILLRPEMGLVLIAFFAPFYLEPKILWQKAFSMAEIITVLTAAAWVIRSGLSRLGEWKKQILGEYADSQRIRRWLLSSSSASKILDLSVFVFCFAGLLSALGAEFQKYAWRDFRVVILEPALFYLVLRTLPLARRDLWRIVDAFVAGAVIVALVGLIYYASGTSTITAEEGVVRLQSVNGSPNNVALYLGRALPLLLAVLAIGRGWRRIVYGIAAIPVVLALVLSVSKGALLFGIPAALAVMAVLWLGRRAILALAGAGAVGLAGFLALLRVPALAGRLDLFGGTTLFRLNLWQSALAMIHDHPWLGVGPDNFLYEYRGRYVRPAAWQEPNLSHPHNFILDLWTRIGLLGLASGLAMQVAFWRLSLGLWKRLHDPLDRALVLGLVGAMADTLAHGMVDNSIFLVDLGFAFFLILGITQALAHPGMDLEPQRREEHQEEKVEVNEVAV